MKNFISNVYSRGEFATGFFKEKQHEITLLFICSSTAARVLDGGGFFLFPPFLPRWSTPSTSLLPRRWLFNARYVTKLCLYSYFPFWFCF